MTKEQLKPKKIILWLIDNLIVPIVLSYLVNQAVEFVCDITTVDEAVNNRLESLIELFDWLLDIYWGYMVSSNIHSKHS